MSAPSLRDAFRVGLAVVGSTVSKATGAILLTLADTFHQTQESVTAELWNPGGWLYIAEISRSSFGNVSKPVRIWLRASRVRTMSDAFSANNLEDGYLYP